MFANSSDLLSQINTIIQSNCLEEKFQNLDPAVIENAIENAKSSPEQNHLDFLKGSQLKKLENRVDKLEDQNDQLLCIIYFLFRRILNLADQTIEVDQPNEKTKTRRTATNHKERKQSDIAAEKERPTLTKREMDVFILLEKGLCAKEIAKTLFISETTVITHKKNLKEKFNARNTVELISKVLTNIA